MDWQEIALEEQKRGDAFEALIHELRAEIADLKEQIRQLQAQNSDFKRQLKQNSQNSSKPPSSDGFKKPPCPPKSLRTKTGKSSGGQVGHKGTTLRQSETPDTTINHTLSHCPDCKNEFTPRNRRHTVARQVFDIPPPRLEVTEHLAQVYHCQHCKNMHTAAFPEHVTQPAQYGARIKTAAVYLHAQQLVPEDRVCDIFRDLYGAASICARSIVSWCQDAAKKAAQLLSHLAATLREARVRHADETGFRVGGKTQWLHVLSNNDSTLYAVSAKRGAVSQNLDGGILVHDHFKSYLKLQSVDHVFCNAHHARELRAVHENDREPWAKALFKVLLYMNACVHRARKAGKNSLPVDVLADLEARYDRIVLSGLRMHEAMEPLPRLSKTGRAACRKGHNLLQRLHKYKTGTLRFLHDFAVPFTNNLAEQDLRMMKVKMKISGGFRTLAGAECFAALRSVISTARKRGSLIFQTLLNGAFCLSSTA